MAEWVVLYKSNNANNTQIAKSVLEDNEIEVVLINKMDTVNVHLINASFIELHVKPTSLIKARHLIDKHSL